MIDDIINGRGERFGAGKLKEMCKLLPEDGEVGVIYMVQSLVSLVEQFQGFGSLPMAFEYTFVYLQQFHLNCELNFHLI